MRKVVLLALLLQAPSLGPGKPKVLTPAQQAEIGTEYPVPAKCNFMVVESKASNTYVIASTSTWHTPQAEINQPSRIICKENP
jgi:hypothetical protein